MNSYSVAERINSDVNASVKYKTDLGQYGVPEFWTMAGKFGDCEDYALAKRSALLHAGWPKDKLGLCVCYTQSGEGHCAAEPVASRVTIPLEPTVSETQFEAS